MSPPPWLPQIVDVNGEWQDILLRLYQIFENDFKNGGCRFCALPIFWDRRILDGETHEEGLLHLITRTDQKNGYRLFDPRRAERLSWCSPVIHNSDDQAVRIWDCKKKRQVKTYLWLEDLDYVVVLKKARHNVILVTAFHVDGDSTRRNLRKTYDRRER